MNIVSCIEIPLTQTRLFSPIFSDFLNQAPWTREITPGIPDKETLLRAAAANAFDTVHRTVLVQVLEEQYDAVKGAGDSVSDRVRENITSLGRSDTRTITTGQQLHPASGPLYVVFKALSTIKLCNDLNQAGSGQHFVPVFWIASEDHDLEEIRGLQVAGKSFRWETDQQGCTGRMHCEGLEQLLDEAGALLGTRPGVESLRSDFLLAYKRTHSLSLATRILLNRWFGALGLVVLDADHPALKSAFVQVMARDLTRQEAPAAARKLEETMSALGKLPINIRPVNLFYIGNGFRLRIDPYPTGFRTADEQFNWTLESILEELKKHPERFSPNVVLRPLYQQTILPNVAYIGGAAEVSYWLQLKPVFDLHGIPFPFILPRAHGMLIESSLATRFEQLGFTELDLFAAADELTNRFLARQGVSDQPFRKVVGELEQAMDALTGFISTTDPSLGDAGRAEKVRMIQSIERLEDKWKRSVKRQEEQSIQLIRKAKERAFPQGVLQERSENILGFIGLGGLRHPADLLDEMDPLKSVFRQIRI